MLMAQASSAWTLADLDRLPDDSNKYELVDGDLFARPASSPVHEVLATALRELLDPYVRLERSGRVYVAKLRNIFARWWHDHDPLTRHP